MFNSGYGMRFRHTSGSAAAALPPYRSAPKAAIVGLARQPQICRTLDVPLRAVGHRLNCIGQRFLRLDPAEFGLVTTSDDPVELEHQHQHQHQRSQPLGAMSAAMCLLAGEALSHRTLHANVAGDDRVSISVRLSCARLRPRLLM